MGVSPWHAKAIQLLLLIAAMAALPVIGWHLMGHAGVWSGAIGGLLFLDIWLNKMATNILTEALIVVTIVATLGAWLLFKRSPSVIGALLFGLVLGFNPLVKGSLIFSWPITAPYNRNAQILWLCSHRFSSFRY